MGLLMSLPHLQARAGSRCRQCRLGTEAGLGNVHIAVSANGQYVHADEAEESSSAVAENTPAQGFQGWHFLQSFAGS